MTSMWTVGLQCVTLIKWLEERYETVYRQHPGFQEGSSPLSLQEQVLPLDLPDTLRGEEWAFVQLPFESVFSTVQFHFSVCGCNHFFGLNINCNLLMFTDSRICFSHIEGTISLAVTLECCFDQVSWRKWMAY